MSIFKDMDINRVTLSFKGRTEKDYQDYYFDDSLGVFRIAFLFVLILYGLFGYLDTLFAAEYKDLFYLIRFRIVVPFLFMVYIISFFRIFKNIWQWLSAASTLLSGLGIIIMIVHIPDNITYYGGLMLVFAACYFFIKLRFIFATFSGLILVLCFNYAMIYYSDIATNTLLAYNFFYISANLINMVAAYYIEFFSRKSFYLNNQLDRKRFELENSNVELKILNDSIAEETQKLLILNEKLAISEQQLLEANQTKDKFFTIIAHDLKNPIGGMRSMIETMALYFESLSKEETLQMLKQLHKTSNITVDLLENLLQWASIQTRRIHIEAQISSLSKLILNNYKLARSQADKKNIKIDIFAADDIVANFDENAINTVLRNLISNAIKFTPDGGNVEIGLINDNIKQKVGFYVKDNGIGMSPEVLSNLFKVDQVKSLLGTSGEKGTGLGLILCKEFIERHNGEIVVESENGKGTVFYVYLPIIKLNDENNQYD